jgi:hypothetical protein
MSAPCLILLFRFAFKSFFRFEYMYIFMFWKMVISFQSHHFFLD